MRLIFYVLPTRIEQCLKTHVHRLNQPLFDLDETHPAREFLDAFIDCRRQCVGRELEGIDQIWWSSMDGREKKFSSFAYESLSFDVELDGWLSDSPVRTNAEIIALKAIPNDERRMRECREAASDAGNVAVVETTDIVLRMLALWRNAIESRIK